MSFSARAVADSKNTFGNRLTTMAVTFPRFILAELNTHRMFSRNSASSRAIPSVKIIKAIKDNPFVPLAWQVEHSGMQGSNYFNKRESEVLNSAWLLACNRSIDQAIYLLDKQATKQLVNRMLEPYMWHTALITASEWENFFALRCPQYMIHQNGEDTFYRSRKDLLKSIEVFPQIHEAVSKRTEEEWFTENKSQAEIHIQRLAELMWDAMNESNPKQLQPGEWHIPYGDQIDEDQIKSTLWEKSTIDGYEVYAKQNDVLLPEASANFVNRKKIEIAVARCARVSYTVVGDEDKPADYTKDIALYDRLKASGHMSPFEHIGRAMTESEYYTYLSGVYPGSTDNEGNIFLYETYATGEYKNDKIVDMYGWSGNFRGFIQHRKMLPGENITVK